jgi:hypothetical protein
MKKEQCMQELIIKFPSEVLEEPELDYLEREIKTGGRRLDIVLKDRRGRHVLVEVQAGALDTKHIDRHIDFVEGYLEKHPQIDIRVLFVANSIDVHKKNFLQKLGYEFKEISESRFRKIGTSHGYSEEDAVSNRDSQKEVIAPLVKSARIKNDMEINISADDLIRKLKSTRRYGNLKSQLFRKIKNEAAAKKIIEESIGGFDGEILRRIFQLVDEPYTHAVGGDARPWFGRMINLNAPTILKAGTEKINNWFNILIEAKLPVQERIDLLRKGQNHINGANVGLITLILYLLDKSKYSVWFEPHHKGLRIIYPEMGKFNSKGSQYIEFNNLLKGLAKKYEFDDTEMDWVLQELPTII